MYQSGRHRRQGSKGFQKDVGGILLQGSDGIFEGGRGRGAETGEFRFFHCWRKRPESDKLTVFRCLGRLWMMQGTCEGCD